MPGATIRAGIVGGYDPHEDGWGASMNANLAALAARTDPAVNPMPAAPLWAHHFDGADEIAASWTDVRAVANGVTKAYTKSRVILACPAGDGTAKIGGWARAMDQTKDIRVRWSMGSHTYNSPQTSGLIIGFRQSSGPFGELLAVNHQYQSFLGEWDQAWIPRTATPTSLGAPVAGVGQSSMWREAWFQMRWNGTTKMVAWDWSPSGHRYVKGLEVTADSLFGAGNFVPDSFFIGLNRQYLLSDAEYEMDWVVAEQTYALND